MKQIQLFLFVIFVLCCGRPRSTASIAGDKDVVCFIYHRFDDSRYPSTNVSVRDFEQHLDYLKKNNFQVLSFSDALRYLQSEEPSRNTAVITVDDGYKSFFKNGFPLLKKYNFPATLFINTETVGGGDYMNWAELKEVTSSNIEIGNHTHSHDFFLNESASSRYKTFKEEIELSQLLIDKNLNITPQVFSYPYGEFDSEMKDIVKSAGFKAAAAQNSGVIYNGTDLYQCPRFPMSEAYSAKEKFVEKVSAKALRVLSLSPNHFIMPDDKRPLLTLIIDNTNLRLQQLQCFVQGGECDYKVAGSDGRQTTITLQAGKPITGRRRTLYTITVPDKNGKWHWYSHLWINSKVN